MTAGCLASGARSAQRVLIGLAGAVDTAQRRKDHDARSIGGTDPGLELAGRATREAGINRASTSHSPCWRPYTQAVIETGPVPGTMPSIVSSFVKLSPALGAPRTPVRRPVKRTVAS